ncbi:hypothetical protein BJ742DRAFT_848827 [Cladochytrium replicatum]|nr:hypothetical protein BJ742DRAFT_848827 [Cladochytrium replicatum]
MAEAREWRRRLELKARDSRPLFDTNERSRLLKKNRLKRQKSRADFAARPVDFAELPKNVSRLPHEIKLKILTSMPKPNLTFLAAVNVSRSRYRSLMEDQSLAEWRRRFRQVASVSLLYYFSSCSTWSELGVKIHSSWVFNAARGGPKMLPVLKSMMRFRIRSAADPYVWKMVGNRGTEVSCSWPELVFDACLNDEALVVSSLFPTIQGASEDEQGNEDGSSGSGCRVWTQSFEAIHCVKGEGELQAVFGKRAGALKLSKKDRNFNVKRIMEGATTVVTDMVENIIVEMEHRSLPPYDKKGEDPHFRVRRKELVEGMMSGKLRLIDSIVSNALMSAAMSAQAFEAVKYLRRRAPHVITSAIERANGPLATARDLFEQHFQYYNTTVGIYPDSFTGVVHPMDGGEPCMYFKGRQLCNFQAEQARLLFEIATDEKDAETAGMFAGFAEYIDRHLTYDLLTAAATNGELDLVRAIAPKLTLGQHQDAYLLAIRHGRAEVAQFLATACRDKLAGKYDETATHTFRSFATGFGAVKEGHPRAESTMKALAELLERDMDKVEALRAASVRGKAEVVKYILANVEFVDRRGAVSVVQAYLSPNDVDHAAVSSLLDAWVKDGSEKEMKEEVVEDDDEDGEWEDADEDGGGGGSDTSDNYWNWVEDDASSESEDDH